MASGALAVLLASGVAFLAALALAPAASAADPGHGASFAVRCDFSHRNSDDPVVHPGHQGAAHSHDFFGNRSTKFDSTYASMLAEPTSCTRVVDTAGYWFPTVKWSGDDLQAHRAVFYYRAGGKDHTQVKPFDADLKMISGTRISWSCGVDDTEAGSQAPPTQCSTGVLGVRIIFPDCSNGEIDSVDHKAHMARSVTQSDGERRCPSTHPVPVPALTINANFAIPTTPGEVTLSSGSASTMHSDFWNIWDQQALNALVAHCINSVPPSEPRPEECRAPNADDGQEDFIPPNTTVTSGPPGITRDTSASFSFVGSETDSTLECSLDGAGFTACVSPKDYDVANGSHTFSVRAEDAAGNADTTPASRTWTVDTVRPAITPVSPRHASTTRDTTPLIRATVRDNNPLAKANAKLYVGGRLISATKYSYAPSTGALVYKSPKLPKGKKTMKVVATDAAGNAFIKSWVFRIR